MTSFTEIIKGITTISLFLTLMYAIMFLGVASQSDKTSDKDIHVAINNWERM